MPIPYASFYVELMRFIAFIIATTAVAGDYSNRDLAVLIHNRIAGVPPSDEVLAEMADLIEQDKKQEAALKATEDPAFYNVKLFNLFSSWTNVAGTSRVNLNDMTATLIGIVRDNLPFSEALTGNYLYTAEDGIKVNGALIPAYSPTSNEHYRQLQKTTISRKTYLTKNKKHYMPQNLSKKEQKTLHTQKPFDSKAIAGILSSRGFAEAYFSDGTNRRATAFVLKYFLCHDMESLHDIKDVDDSKVRKDVSRSPGGDPQLFRKRCVGCHAGMDALSGWNLYHNFIDNQLTYNKDKDNPPLLTCDKTCREKLKKKNKLTREQINKINFNDAMDGDVADVTDDSFTNPWTTGQNASLGWGGATSGNGANQWGQMIAGSKAFATCMATHVYQHVCMVTPTSLREKNLRDTLAKNFAKNIGDDDRYNMKKLFAMTAAGCLPGEK